MTFSIKLFLKQRDLSRRHQKEVQCTDLPAVGAMAEEGGNFNICTKVYTDKSLRKFFTLCPPGTAKFCDLPVGETGILSG